MKDKDINTSFHGSDIPNYMSLFYHQAQKNY